MPRINGKTITGLGDLVEAANEATGKDCGCGNRKDRLNDRLSFHPKEG